MSRQLTKCLQIIDVCLLNYQNRLFTQRCDTIEVIDSAAQNFSVLILVERMCYLEMLLYQYIYLHRRFSQIFFLPRVHHEKQFTVQNPQTLRAPTVSQ